MPPIVAAGAVLWNGVVRFPRLVKLGLVAPFGRLDAEAGYAVYFGARLAVREWNEGPQREAFRVELLTQDDLGTAAGGELEARKMVADPDVVAVVGHPALPAAAAAAPVYSSAGMPFVSLAPGPVGADGALVWQLLGDADEPTQHAVRFLTSAAQPAPAVARTSDEAVRWNEDRTAGQLLLVGLAASPAVARLIRSGFATHALIPMAPPSEAVESAFAVPYREQAERQEWWLSAVTYDAVRLTLRAIGQAYDVHDLSRAGVAAALARMEPYAGVAGEIRFDAEGRRANPEWYLYRLQGEFPGVPVARCMTGPSASCSENLTASSDQP